MWQGRGSAFGMLQLTLQNRNLYDGCCQRRVSRRAPEDEAPRWTVHWMKPSDARLFWVVVKGLNLSSHNMDIQ